MTSSVASPTATPPRLRVAPPAAETYGDLAADFTSNYGLTPDPWQRLVLDDWLAEDTAGQWAALTCGLSAPRQNGKNGILEAREIFGAVGRGERILHTAHQVKTSQKHFRRLKHFFGKRVNDPGAVYPELNALVVELRNVNGQEAIYLHNGGAIELVARSAGASGRGFTVDVAVFDEAQDLSHDDHEALLSTTSAGPLGNTQWIYAGTPPGPRAAGEVFTSIRNDALGESPHRLSWLEWSSEPPLDLDDPATWAAANPALDIRVMREVVQGERDRFSDAGFMRERLGMWPSLEQARRVISADLWATAARLESPQQRPDALAIDMSHDRVIAIAAAVNGTGGQPAHVELVAVNHADTDTLATVEWIAERAKRRMPVLLAADSPAASMAPALKARKVKTIQVGTLDLAKACGLFYDDATHGRLTHGAQRQLDDALAGAAKRDLREAGAWIWDRRDPATNLAPLMAATLARYGAAQRPAPTASPRPRKVVVRS